MVDFNRAPDLTAAVAMLDPPAAEDRKPRREVVSRLTTGCEECKKVQLVLANVQFQTRIQYGHRSAHARSSESQLAP